MYGTSGRNTFSCRRENHATEEPQGSDKKKRKDRNAAIDCKKNKECTAAAAAVKKVPTATTNSLQNLCR